ncbi:MAG: DUF1624 domain-containing protein [Hydrotalea sp. AMD]|uniref:acyltransferase family protein n=1 Tax=Hydrotalea sp. AMD TaxID=2501297 RepID=UPI000944E79C|nr:heparan-alpha-glucosaminide N-acetyltransferase domain-containing protein [Hydrotalea sp. AMD]RWZ88169.1 MAG: DUF1624 domain-containing protein [Hydrotalea sp. AMD]
MQQQRYYSLDVFRGATVALMILVNNPGSWEHIYTPLEHAPWHGCTPTDLVFPFFLFAVGNAFSFVMPRFEQNGNSYFLKKVFKRSILIFLIGLFLNWTPFVQWSNGHIVFKGFEHVRIMGVLQRIALSYFFAALIIYYAKARGAFVIGCIILLLYWVFTLLAGEPGDPYSLQGFWGTSFDIHVFGLNHVYKGEGVPFDPEGLSSTPGAVVQVIIGYLTGQYIQQKGKTYDMLANLLVLALVLMAAGYAWDMVFPINKKIWSSSYVVYTSGLAIATLGILIYAIEFKEVRGAWSSFFDVFGKNPLFIFVLSGFLPRVLGLIRIPHGMNEEGLPVYLSPLGWFYEQVCKPISTDEHIGSLLYALILIAFYWLIVYGMDKKKIYIKV